MSPYLAAPPSAQKHWAYNQINDHSTALYLSNDTFLQYIMIERCSTMQIYGGVSGSTYLGLFQQIYDIANAEI